MTELDLQSAVDQIVRATRNRTSHGIAPFFFVVGAGISHPPIPLAAGIEEMCRKEIVDQGRTPPSAGKSPLDRYQACFEMAFEQADERRTFLHEHLHAARISAANFRLAHLLSEGDLTKLVFTPNFDEMLTRALRLFGHEAIICDHPKTTQRIDPGRADLQVIHVHGTHWFYDCCNLRGEIEGQARSDLADSTSMGQLLDRVLAERSPLVVGYSGWEGDVLMTALHRRLRQPTLPFNLYWFCYRRSELRDLPDWLRDHASVRLVLPPMPPDAAASEPAGRLPKVTVEPLGGEPESESGSSEQTLHARDVFEAFIQKLDLKAPHLTAEPLEFFLRHLERNLDPEDTSGRLYLLREVFDRVRVGVELERSRRLGDSPAQQRATEALRRLSDAVRRSAYPAAAQAAIEIDVSVLSEPERREFDEILGAVYLGLADSQAELGLGVCEVWSKLAEVALASGTPDSTSWSASVARALYGKGYCLTELGQLEAAVDAFSQLVQRFRDSPEPALREQVAKALFKQGIALNRVGKPKAAIEAYTQVVERFGEAPEPAFRELVAKALFNQSHAHDAAGNPEAAAAAYSQVIQRFADGPEPALRQVAARALVNEGGVLRRAGKPEAAVATYLQVVQRFGDAPELGIREAVARALVNRGIAFGEAGKPKAAVEAWSQMLERFAAAPEPELQEQVARVFVNQGDALRKAGKLEAAVEAWSQVVHRFGTAPESGLRKQVATALLFQGIAHRKAGRPEAAVAAYSQIVERFGDSPEPALQRLAERARSLSAKAAGRADQGSAPALGKVGRHSRRLPDAPPEKL